MRTPGIAACCVLWLANGAVARTSVVRLRPDDTDGLRAARIHVSCRIVNAKDNPDNPEYAFEISAGVPEGFDSLVALFAVRNHKGLVTNASWSSSGGKCIATFVVGKQMLPGAWFEVLLFKGDGLSENGHAFALRLSEFTGERGVAPPEENFEITTPIRRGGPALSIAVKRKDAASNHWYDLHVSVAGRSDQHFEVRNGQPISQHDIRLASLNGDGYLDIMIVGGTDHRGQQWYKTLIYNEEQQQYRWLTD